MPPRAPTVPVLTDGAVTLRGPRPEDAQGSWEQCQDPLSQRWTSVPLPYSLDDARRYVGDIIPGGWATDREWHFVLEHDGRFGGTLSLRNEGDRRAELAYGSHPGVRGTGAMERGVRLLLDWGFAPESDGGRGLQTVIWWAHVGNWASRKLAWRLGFAIEGSARKWLEQRGELRDAWVGTLLRDDARAPRHPWYDVPRIVGAGIVLRSHRDEDAERVRQAGDDQRTSYWLGGMPAPYTLADAEQFLRDRPLGMATGTAVHWMVADPGNDQLLGTVSVLRIADGTGEIGYWTHPDARGRGVMTEAVRLAVRHAFVDPEAGGLGLARLTLFAAVDNAASRHVAEANGFRPTGIERQAINCRDGRHDMAGYDLLPTDLRV
jgi:RimJ/RimL family protein N-acetyltransferase